MLGLLDDVRGVLDVPLELGAPESGVPEFLLKEDDDAGRRLRVPGVIFALLAGVTHPVHD